MNYVNIGGRKSRWTVPLKGLPGNFHQQPNLFNITFESAGLLDKEIKKNLPVNPDTN